MRSVGGVSCTRKIGVRRPLLHYGACSNVMHHYIVFCSMLLAGMTLLPACSTTTPAPQAPTTDVAVRFPSTPATSAPSQDAQRTTAHRLHTQAAALAKAGNYAEAEPLYKEALALRQQSLGATHPDVAVTLQHLADLYHAQGRADLAAPFERQMLTVLQHTLPSAPIPARVSRLNDEAQQYQAAGQYAKAEERYRQALELLQRSHGRRHSDVATLMNNLATLASAQKQHDKAAALYKETVAIKASTLGPTHPDVATALTNLANLHFTQKRYQDAEPLYQRAIAIWEQGGAPQHVSMALALHHLAELYATQERYTDAKPLYQRALTIRQQALGSAHADVAASMHGLAEVARGQGHFAEAENLYQRALGIRERVLGPQHTYVALSLGGLARLYYAQGRYQEARVFYQRSLPVLEQHLAPDHRLVITSLADLASIAYSQSKYSEAETLYQRAIQLRQATLGPDHPEVAGLRTHLASVYYAQRKYADAERLDRRALAVLQQQSGTTYPEIARTLMHLASIARVQQKYDDAAALYSRAREILETTLGTEHAELATVLTNLAGVQRAQGHTDRALALYQKALALQERTLGKEHPEVARSLHELGHVHQDQQQYATAMGLYERALALRERLLGDNHPDVAASLSAIATLHQVQEQYTQAEPLYRTALAMLENTLGPEHPDIAVALHNLATVLVNRRQHTEALPLYERARRLQLTIGRRNADLDDATLRHLQQQGDTILQAYLMLLTRLAHHLPLSASPRQTAIEAFRVAEQLRGGLVQAALTRAAARTAAATPAMAARAQQVQRLRGERRRVREALTTLYATPIAQRDATRLTQRQQQERRLDQAIAETDKQLRHVFPQYAELATPEPVTPQEVRQLLRPGEALVSFFLLRNRLLTWLVRPDRPPVYHASTIVPDTLPALVNRVRTSMDQSKNALFVHGKLAPVDVKAAHELYTLLLAPVRAALDGVHHMLVVPDAALMSLPFGTLVTDTNGAAYQTLLDHGDQPLSLTAPQLAAYTQLAWLARDYALTILPSATSLRALRQRPGAPGTGSQRLIGFGDPVLQGHGTQRGAPMLAEPGTRAALETLQRLPALPGTREELERLTQVLDVDPQHALYVGEQATESMLRTLNANGRLATTQVLYFATHGLIGGEIAGLAQPALVLTPPQAVTLHDDGLLSMDEILVLHLPQTEWVVLSACNTAAADNSGEGLSGLARAFFFAGAQSVLVSHWSVEDRATQALMTAVFQQYAQQPTMARAEALRQGMLAMLHQAQGQTAYFAHPFAWAPFFLVGEGAGKAVQTSGTFAPAARQWRRDARDVIAAPHSRILPDDSSGALAWYDYHSAVPPHRGRSPQVGRLEYQNGVLNTALHFGPVCTTTPDYTQPSRCYPCVPQCGCDRERAARIARPVPDSLGWPSLPARAPQNQRQNGS